MPVGRQHDHLLGLQPLVAQQVPQQRAQLGGHLLIAGAEQRHRGLAAVHPKSLGHLIPPQPRRHLANRPRVAQVGVQHHRHRLKRRLPLARGLEQALLPVVKAVPAERWFAQRLQRHPPGGGKVCRLVHDECVEALAAHLCRRQQQLGRLFLKKPPLRRCVRGHHIFQARRLCLRARQLVERQHRDARHIGQPHRQRLRQCLVKTRQQHRLAQRRVLTRQRHRQHRLARARAALHQQTRLRAQHAQHCYLLLRGLVQGMHRVVHPCRQRHQAMAVRCQQLLQHMLLRPRPGLRARHRLAKNPQQRRRGVGQRSPVQQKRPRRCLGAGQPALPHHIGEPHRMCHAQPIHPTHDLAPQPLAQLVHQRIPVAPRLGEGRLLHRQPRRIKPPPIPHLHRPRLHLKKHQPMLRVKHQHIRLANHLTLEGEIAPLHRVEELPGRRQVAQRGQHAGLGAFACLGGGGGCVCPKGGLGQHVGIICMKCSCSAYG